MNKAKLKAYAPQARKDFIAAVTARANQLGLTLNKSELVIAPATRQGDVTLIEGREWLANVYTQRENLIKRMQREGFEQVIEAVAYTWFNRFAALRYMELHDYLGHGYRVLSSTAEGAGAHTPDILLHAVDLAQSQALPGLKADSVNQLKLAGNQDAELYRRLLIAQCNALSNAMPFLFERIDDETELLLPDNLLRTDSVIAKLVEEIPEEDWAQVEIVGWLYQFYISEKKDQVIGKVVKSEDIPAATQLFTPNWIVQYLVQNSVGRLWMMANPQSTLKSQWPYYIEPAEQTAEVNAQLDALIKTRMDEDGGSLNPETITVLDPACGSGHILVEAYELLKGIYLERGFRLRDIPRLILEKNLYGLDIDDRAAQMAGFALLMKARADDRRLLEEPIALNVLSLQESKGLPQEEIATALAAYGVSAEVVKALLITFEHAKTFGSLIQIPETLNEQLPELADALSKASKAGDLYAHQAANDLLPLVWQGLLLGRQYDAVVANPPYMGGKGLNVRLKAYLQNEYEDMKSDLFSAFIVRCTEFACLHGFLGVMCPNVWMYISSHQKLREFLISKKSISSLVELPLNGFKGATVQICAFLFNSWSMPDVTAKFIRLVEFDGGDDEMAKRTKEAVLNESCGWVYNSRIDDFEQLPGCPIAYWATRKIFKAFQSNQSLESFGLVRQGASTSDNARFLKLWHEISFNKIGFGFESLDKANESSLKWFPYNKGGAYRKWYGNQEYVINYENDGQELKAFQSTLNQGWTVRLKSREYYFLPSVSWPKISSGRFSARYYPPGFIFDVAGCCFFPDAIGDIRTIISYLNSVVAEKFLEFLSPTLNFEIEQVKKLPYINPNTEHGRAVEELYSIFSDDWNASEVAWGFKECPVVFSGGEPGFLQVSWEKYRNHLDASFSRAVELEKFNNLFWLGLFGLLDEISAEVPCTNVALRKADATKDSQSLVSYVVGCMMGRYSLDEPGLIYAHAGNEHFDPKRYSKFPADLDGIVPVTDKLWFEDDAANRVREFLVAVWGADTLDENMTWLAESLGKKESESSEETIRRYLADKFYKDHLQTYKKRPIYWLFSSGKQGAFQALVYLHRYNEGTLARMRAEYVVPLTGKMQTRIDMLEKDKDAASSTAARNMIAKQIESLKKKHVELLAYDEKLRHYADMRISLDLDDGVKVNYGKFGDLLAEVKAVTGGTGDD